MSLIPPFIFACTVNIDAFLVGISYGLRNSRITICQNLFISLIAFVGTICSIFFGSAILKILPPLPTKWLGGCILIVWGLFYFFKYLLFHFNILPVPTGAPLRLPLSLRATILLGASLSCNNIGIGIGASIGGISFLPTAIITFFTSVFFLFAGNTLGHSPFFRLPHSLSDLLSAILLIILGLCNSIQ